MLGYISQHQFSFMSALFFSSFDSSYAKDAFSLVFQVSRHSRLRVPDLQRLIFAFIFSSDSESSIVPISCLGLTSPAAPLPERFGLNK